MAYNSLKYQIMLGFFELAGQSISSYLLQPNFDEQHKIRQQYYAEAKEIVKKDNKEREKIIKNIERKKPEEQVEIQKIPEQDLSEKKIEGGVACLPCSRDHFSTVSGALGEAIRFSRREGVTHPEVQKRLGMSLDELNMLERIDLSPEETALLKGQEKQLAEWGLNKARALRHRITAIRSHADLENTAAEASKIRTYFMTKLWDVITVDGSIEKLCKGLKDEERKRCTDTINTIMKNKKGSAIN